jgi:hypothetical protein
VWKITEIFRKDGSSIGRDPNENFRIQILKVIAGSFHPEAAAAILQLLHVVTLCEVHFSLIFLLFSVSVGI